MLLSWAKNHQNRFYVNNNIIEVSLLHCRKKGSSSSSQFLPNHCSRLQISAKKLHCIKIGALMDSLLLQCLFMEKQKLFKISNTRKFRSLRAAPTWTNPVLFLVFTGTRRMEQMMYSEVNHQVKKFLIKFNFFLNLVVQISKVILR